ncbi:acyl carrier protein [Streptomyces sp. NPDC002851]
MDLLSTRTESAGNEPARTESAGTELAGLIALFRDELGVELTERDLDTDLDALPGWDSVHLLRLVLLLEEGTGRRLPLPDVLEARTVRRLHTLVSVSVSVSVGGVGVGGGGVGSGNGRL